MSHKCIIGNINKISAISDKFIINKIREENLPILRNHIPLFYILPISGEPMLFNELASKWGISKSSLSDIISKYESIGIVEKINCKEDKRTVYIRLTKKAESIVSKLKLFENEFITLVLNGFTEEEQYEFKDNMEKALKNAMKIL